MRSETVRYFQFTHAQVAPVTCTYICIMDLCALCAGAVIGEAGRFGRAAVAPATNWPMTAETPPPMFLRLFHSVRVPNTFDSNCIMIDNTIIYTTQYKRINSMGWISKLGIKNLTILLPRRGIRHQENILWYLRASIMTFFSTK